MATELLYRDDAYLREARATVVASGPDGVVLDRTPFYVQAGGQPGDAGLLRWAEAQVGAMLRGALPGADLVAPVRIARIALMAFDGFAIGRKLRPASACDHATIAQMASLLLPEPPPRRPRTRRSL